VEKRPSVAYFLSHPIQYFSPLLKEMAKRMNLTVYYFSDASIKGQHDKEFGVSVQWDTPLLEGYNYIFLKNYSRRQALTNRFLDVFNPAVVGVLRKTRPDIVIVNGWTYSSTWLVLLFAKMFGSRVWLRAENPLNQEVRKSKKVLFAKKLLLKRLLFGGLVNKGLYIGTENRLFFEYYGLSGHKLVYTPYAVDNNYFATMHEGLRDRVPGIRRQLKLPVDKKIILFSGKFIHKKRPMDLVRAFHALNNTAYALVMVGEGELRTEMEQYIAANQLQQVYLTGFINQSVIPQYYAIADVFVMCSGMGETWGLSVNEAMNFEKPVVVSATCGCSTDLVHHEDNGLIFEEGNIEQLANGLRRILENDIFRHSAGKRSGVLIKKFSIVASAQNMEAAAGNNN
jgi:glycosyltransferase involved in cell wall biosynthesis